MSFGLTFFGDIVVGAGAYVLAIYTWPTVSSFLTSTESQIAKLEAKLAAAKAAASAAAPPAKPPGT